MYGQERRKTPRNTTFLVDMFHILVGIAIVILGVISFLNPEGNMLLFPIIFLLAAVLNMANGIYRVRQNKREKKKKMAGLSLILFGIVLMFLAVVSAVSIWWG